jgi:hypothetical protein
VHALFHCYLRSVGLLNVYATIMNGQYGLIRALARIVASLQIKIAALIAKSMSSLQAVYGWKFSEQEWAGMIPE